MSKSWRSVDLNTDVRFKRTPEVDALIQKEYEVFWEENSPAYLNRHPVSHMLLEEATHHRMVLWSFMSTFSKYMGNGFVLPTELINIEILV